MNESINKSSIIEKGISIFTAVNTYQSRKLNEQILNQQYKNNFQLASIREKLNEANTLNKQILENQLKTEKYKEAQKFYKALSFNLHETIEIISRINDSMVLNYIINCFYSKLKSNIIEVIDQLDEVVDKLYNKELLNKLDALYEKSEETSDLYNSNVLNKVDDLIKDYKEKELKISSLKKPEFNYETTYRTKINVFRTLGILVLGIIIFLIITVIFFALKEIDFYVGITLFVIFAIPFGLFTLLLRKEIKWRNEYEVYVEQEKLKKIEFEKKIVALEQQYENSLKNLQHELVTHPLNDALKEINENHPTFDKYLTDIILIEESFAKKQGLFLEDGRLEDDFDKKVIGLLLEGKRVEAMFQCIEIKGWTQDKVKSYINKLTITNDIPVKTNFENMIDEFRLGMMLSKHERENKS